MRYVLGEFTAERVKQLLAATAGGSGPAAAGGASQGRQLVRCTSATAAAGSGAGAQCYPGVIVTPDCRDTAQTDGREVWLTILDGSGVAVPIVGQYYTGFVAGDLDISGDLRARVFAGKVVSAGDPSCCYYNELNPTSGSGYTELTSITPGAGDWLAQFSAYDNTSDNAVYTIGFSIYTGTLSAGSISIYGYRSVSIVGGGARNIPVSFHAVVPVSSGQKVGVVYKVASGTLLGFNSKNLTALKVSKFT
jgi:hypothetical protein